MKREKTEFCSKKDSEKDLKKNLGEDKFILTFNLGADDKVGIVLDNDGDLDKATDYFIDWFRYGCIGSLLAVGQELVGDDAITTAQIIKDFLRQLHSFSENELGLGDKKKALNKFAELFRKSIESEEDDED